MKKILLSAGLIFMVICVNAQDFRLGLKAHPTFGYLSSEETSFERDGIRLGFSYGLLIDYGFAENYAFATELSVTTNGGKFSTKLNDTVYSNSYMLQYVEVPLTLKLRTSEIGSMRYYGQFGLSLGVNVKARNESSKTYGATTSDVVRTDIEDEINLLRMGLIIGAGVEYGITGNTELTAGITFNNGFTDIASDDNMKIINSYFALNIGVLF